MSDKNKPIGYECRFSVFCQSKDTNDDIHLVKEIAHYEDGTREPKVRLIKNYQRTFGVTKKGMQNHKEKKEREFLSNLNLYKSTQSNLLQSASRALGQPWFRGTMRELQNSPYLYGTDISSTALIKQYYLDKFPDLKSPYSVAVIDTETSMVDGTIIMASLTYKGRAFQAIRKDFVQGYPHADLQVKELALSVYLKELLEKRKVNLEVILVDEEIDIVKTVMAKAHEWKPDFLTVWNILFDMEKIQNACKRANVKIEDVMCDPSVPEEYRFFKFDIGPGQKTTSSGVVHNFKPAQRWHTVYCPSSFYWIDAMCAYRHVRQGSQEEPNYKLDNILFKVLGIRKLNFTQADHITNKTQWHTFMQSKYPLEYCVYNLFDSIGIELLDEKTTDLQIKLALFSGCSDFSKFNSQPRRKCDNYHGYLLKQDPPSMIATTGSNMVHEFDKLTWGLDDWIVMLQPHPVIDNGLCIIKEDPTLRTNIRVGTSDLDVRASYPIGESSANVGKETNVREFVDIPGVDKKLIRMNFINFSSGHVNALEFCHEIHSMPNIDEWLEVYMLYKGAPINNNKTMIIN